MADTVHKTRGWLASMLGGRDDGPPSHSTLRKPGDGLVPHESEQEEGRTGGGPSGTGTRTGSVSSFEEANTGRLPSRSGSTRKGKKKKANNEAEQEMGLYAQMVADFKAKQGTASGARTVSTSSAEGGSSLGPGPAAAGTKTSLTAAASKETGRPGTEIHQVEVPTPPVNVKAARNRFETAKAADEEDFAMDSLLAKFGASRRGSVKLAASKHATPVAENGSVFNQHLAYQTPPPRAPPPQVTVHGQAKHMPQAGTPVILAVSESVAGTTEGEPAQSTFNDISDSGEVLLQEESAVDSPVDNLHEIVPQSKQDTDIADERQKRAAARRAEFLGREASEQSNRQVLVLHDTRTQDGKMYSAGELMIFKKQGKNGWSYVRDCKGVNCWLPSKALQIADSDGAGEASAGSPLQYAAAKNSYSRAEDSKFQPSSSTGPTDLVHMGSSFTTSQGVHLHSGETVTLIREGKRGWTLVRDGRGVKSWVPKAYLPSKAKPVSITEGSEEIEQPFIDYQAVFQTPKDTRDSFSDETKTNISLESRLMGMSQSIKPGDLNNEERIDVEDIRTRTSPSSGQVLVDAQIGFAQEGAGRWVVPFPTTGRSPQQRRRRSRRRSQSPHKASEQGCSARESPNSPIAGQISFATSHSTSTSPTKKKMSPTAIIPASLLIPSHCTYCGALPSTPNKEGKLRQFRRCAQCKSVDYCSTRCQRLDWKAAHRMECLPFAKMEKFDDSDARNRIQKARLGTSLSSTGPVTHDRAGFRRLGPLDAPSADFRLSVHDSNGLRPHIHDDFLREARCLPDTSVTRLSNGNNSPPRRARNPETPSENRSRSPTLGLQVLSSSEPPSDHIRKPIHSERGIGITNSTKEISHDARTPIFRPTPSPEKLFTEVEDYTASGRLAGKEAASNTLSTLDSTSWDQDTAEMARAWREGTWKKPPSNLLEEAARLRVVSSFEEAAQKHDANMLLDQIARQQLEVAFNTNILTQRFDRGAWISLLSAQHATKVLENDVKTFTATKVLPDPRQRETMEASGCSGLPGPRREEKGFVHEKPPGSRSSNTKMNQDLQAQNSLHADSVSVSELKRAIRLDFVGADQLPFEDGRRLDCRIRLLCASLRPVDLHTYSGKLLRGKLEVIRRAPFDIFLPESNFHDAELEHTIWDLSAGTERFLGGCALRASQIFAPEDEDDALGLPDAGRLSVLLVDLAPDAPDIQIPITSRKIRLMVEHRIKAAPCDARANVEQRRKEAAEAAHPVQPRLACRPPYTLAPWATQDEVFRPSYGNPERYLDKSMLPRMGAGADGWSALWLSTAADLNSFRRGALTSEVVPGRARQSPESIAWSKGH